ncbi:hypothetical protein ATE84_5197 [Aquimarina sp. MAR_2010_214]|uniref:hypothetical protein n=1 Tax=Aquimarina sp. MAR_2010_214 TaxID=1250026 RepID=UPI000C705551|nr:hypothetical protein [Aquimarina sp. MAR_2010_214]PKV53063.1 hypothetical protein ATE84_5197 [Aquimarina sp. MAR_2010_214]
MTKKKKIIIWSGAILVILALAYYFLLPRLIFLSLSTEPRNPTVQIQETHSIGWWSKQEALTVDTFEVQIIESKLNLFNSKSLVKYRIKGSLNYDKGWRPFIKEIHLSERFLTHSDSVENPDAIIEITPIIGAEDDESYNEEKIEFDITNEKIINSFHWGNNKLRFKCLEIIDDINLSQRK